MIQDSIRFLWCDFWAEGLQLSSFCLAEPEIRPKKSGFFPQNLGQKPLQPGQGWRFSNARIYLGGGEGIVVCRCVNNSILDSSNLMSFVQKSFGEVSSHLLFFKEPNPQMTHSEA